MLASSGIVESPMGRLRPPSLRETPQMITEDQVVDAVCHELEAQGWVITRRATTTERGADIVARRHGRDLIVEAKGGTSASASSNRFGRSFSATRTMMQVRVVRDVSRHHSVETRGIEPLTSTLQR